MASSDSRSSSGLGPEEKTFLEKYSPLIACAALFVSGYATYLSSSAIDINQKAARAQLFSNFQQQYGVIASEFHKELLDSNWRPAKSSEDWLKLKRYWDLCYSEWYVTQKLHPDLYAPLWDTFYSKVIGDALAIPSLRGVLLERMQQQHDAHTDEFYVALRALAKEKNISLDPVTSMGQGDLLHEKAP